jgi:hypothetical protein
MCREKDIHGLMMIGELAEPSNLINYMALDFFLRNSKADVWDGLDFVLDERRKGGEKRR